VPEFASATELSDVKATVDALAILAAGTLNEKGYRRLVSRLVRDYLAAADQVEDYHDRLYAITDLASLLDEQAVKIRVAHVRCQAAKP
jgi:hypothetical protein